MNQQLSLEKRKQVDYVYAFYRGRHAVTDWYMFLFKELCNVDYQHFFNWDDFLAEIGWDNDEERWKYIDFEGKPG